MKKKRGFDCVRMKNEAQARMRNDFAGLTAEEERARIAHELETSDDIVAVKWRSLREGQTAANRRSASSNH